MGSNILDEIKADAKTIGEILDKKKYEIDFFQREYKWGAKQIEQLIDDLSTKFLSYYKESDERGDVQDYPRYYLGSIILSLREGKNYIIDGQQRLTSITLLLIFLNNLQQSRPDKVSINELIFSEKFAKKSFNLQVQDRIECMESLYNNLDYDTKRQGESVRNLVDRYNDIEEIFPPEIKSKALPYFIEWLIEKVIMVEIKTHSDEAAYLIFETMNDRGLNLTSTEMLKGYLLAGIELDKKTFLNDLWKHKITNLKELGDPDEDLEFFKAWLRAKYAITVRQRKEGAENEDFEKIGTRFHSWVRDKHDKIGLNTKNDFLNFVEKDFDFYSELYTKIIKAAKNYDKNLKYVYYIDCLNFPRSFYTSLLIAPVERNDESEVILAKMNLVAKYIEIFLVFRRVNNRTVAANTIRYTMFGLIRDIRNKSLSELSDILENRVKEFTENLKGMIDFALNQQNKRFIRYLLARITSHIENECNINSNFEHYFRKDSDNSFEIEHIWSNNFGDHKDEFDQKEEFEAYRNRLGSLILVPNRLNQSYGTDSYENKLRNYFGQNLLAKTLSVDCYSKNPPFIQYINESKLPFKPHEHFKKNDIEERQNLYQKICESIWNSQSLKNS